MKNIKVYENEELFDEIIEHCQSDTIESFECFHCKQKAISEYFELREEYTDMLNKYEELEQEYKELKQQYDELLTSTDIERLH
jgi:predicted methyltransferase